MFNKIKILFALSLIFVSTSVFASTTISYSGSTDILNCTSSLSSLNVAVYKPNTNLIDGGSLTGTASPCYDNSNYSGADGNFYAVISDPAGSAWYTYSTVAAAESNVDWIGTATFTVTSHSISNFVWTPASVAVFGCMDPDAFNYDSLATSDTDPTSCTYPAISIDKGTCYDNDPLRICYYDWLLVNLTQIFLLSLIVFGIFLSPFFKKQTL